MKVTAKETKIVIAALSCTFLMCFTAIFCSMKFSDNRQTEIITKQQDIDLLTAKANLIRAEHNLPNYNPDPVQHSATRSIATSAYTISSTRPAWVYYTININPTSTIASTSSGKVVLQSSPDGTTWTTISDISNSNAVSLAIALQLVNAQDMVLAGYIPKGYQVRMTSTTTGTCTNTYISGFENY